MSRDRNDGQADRPQENDRRCRDRPVRARRGRARHRSRRGRCARPLVGRAAVLSADLLTGPAGHSVVLAAPPASGSARPALGRACDCAAEAGARHRQVTATRSAAALPFGAVAPLLPDRATAPEPARRARRRCRGAAPLGRRARGPLGRPRPSCCSSTTPTCSTTASATLSTRSWPPMRPACSPRCAPATRLPTPSSPCGRTGWRARRGGRPRRRRRRRAARRGARRPGRPGDRRAARRPRAGQRAVPPRARDGRPRRRERCGTTSGIWRLDREPAPSARLRRDRRPPASADLDDDERALARARRLRRAAGPGRARRRCPTSAWPRPSNAAALLAADVDGDRLRVRLAHPLYGDVVRAPHPGGAGRRHRRVAGRTPSSADGATDDDVLRLATWRPHRRRRRPADAARGRRHRRRTLRPRPGRERSPAPPPTPAPGSTPPCWRRRATACRAASTRPTPTWRRWPRTRDDDGERGRVASPASTRRSCGPPSTTTTSSARAGRDRLDPAWRDRLEARRLAVVLRRGAAVPPWTPAWAPCSPRAEGEAYGVRLARRPPTASPAAGGSTRRSRSSAAGRRDADEVDSPPGAGPRGGTPSQAVHGPALRRAVRRGRRRWPSDDAP